MRKVRAGLAAFLFLVAALYGPLAYLHATTPVAGPGDAQPADAALVFGALVRGGEISPLHRQRLDTGKYLSDKDIILRVVVSNAPAAAHAMQRYLVAAGVPEARIEIDTTALKTPDTCRAEAARGTPRSLILISQGYHLPRLAFQCRKLGIAGQYVAAERIDAGPGTATLWTRIRVRSYRHTREAVLLWGALIRYYR